MTETRGQMKEIYCFDMFPSEPLEEEQKTKDDIMNGKFIQHMDFENQDISFMMKQGIGYIYELDHDFYGIRRQQKADFVDFFSKAVDNYIDGDWVNASANLSHAVILNPHDGPMRWLTEYMESLKNLAPEDWKGMRDLDKKQEIPEQDYGNKNEEPKE